MCSYIVCSGVEISGRIRSRPAGWNGTTLGHCADVLRKSLSWLRTRIYHVSLLSSWRAWTCSSVVCHRAIWKWYREMEKGVPLNLSSLSPSFTQFGLLYRFISEGSTLLQPSSWLCLCPAAPGGGDAATSARQSSWRPVCHVSLHCILLLHASGAHCTYQEHWGNKPSITPGPRYPHCEM